MLKSLKFSGIVFLLVVLLTSCNVSSLSLPAPTRLPPTATVIPSPTEETFAIPEPMLFDQPWDDLSIYTQGLTPAYQQTLDSLTDATIYHLDIALDEIRNSLAGKAEILYTNQETVPLTRFTSAYFQTTFSMSR